MKINIYNKESKKIIQNIISFPVNHGKELYTFENLIKSSISIDIEEVNIHQLKFINQFSQEYKILLSASINNNIIYFDYFFKIKNNQLINNQFKTCYYISHYPDLTHYVNPHKEKHTFLKEELVNDYFRSLHLFFHDEAIQYHEEIHREYIKLNTSKILGHAKSEFIFNFNSISNNMAITFYNRNNPLDSLKQINLNLSKDYFEINPLGICLDLSSNSESIKIKNEPRKYFACYLALKYEIDIDFVIDVMESAINNDVFTYPEIIEQIRVLKY